MTAVSPLASLDTLKSNCRVGAAVHRVQAVYHGHRHCLMHSFLPDDRKFRLVHSDSCQFVGTRPPQICACASRPRQIFSARRPDTTLSQVDSLLPPAARFDAHGPDFVNAKFPVPCSCVARLHLSLGRRGRCPWSENPEEEGAPRGESAGCAGKTKANGAVVRPRAAASDGERVRGSRLGEASAFASRAPCGVAGCGSVPRCSGSGRSGSRCPPPRWPALPPNRRRSRCTGPARRR